MVQSLTVSGSGPNQPTLSRWIPVPDVPVRPVLSLDTFLGGRHQPFPCVLDQGHRLEVSAGRIAIARALELMGLMPGDKVLVPAYHCASMIDPLAWVEAKPVFYKITPGLGADIADIESKIDSQTRALMITHYFGFPQKLTAFRQLCDRRGLFLLEDCAHSLFGSQDGVPLGSVGDYSITSLTKFLPVSDGGVMVTSDPRAKSLTLKPQGAMACMLEALGALQESIYYDRLAVLRPLVSFVELTKSALRRVWRSPTRTINPAQSRSGQQGDLDWSWIDTRASVVSALITRFASKDRLACRRIANYRRLAAAFEGLPGCRPILPDLPAGVVPYMFPLWVDQLDRIFPLLEDHAIPMQRFGQFLWPGVDQSVCAHSAALSKHLVQFPCHQELTGDELEWLISTVIETLNSN